ncbi:MAG: GGDEF domain-containing protein [Moritella sp.]|uniref:GGDEF domain-containing protein n=1 Tax=Moritella sp. TaxID=78556 RepID=UPI0029A093C9|nr:GGDEF domain-containing protein [Moritella sp.]MDX2321643.1 GGDEF domain-containing protein [Moritella sp.]
MEVTNKPKLSLAKHGKESISLIIGNRKSLYAILFVSSGLIIPLAVKNYYLGYNLLAFSLVSFVVAAGFVVRALHRGTAITMQANIVVTLLIVSIFLTIHHLGVEAIYWVYPISISLIFILTIKSAIVFNVIIMGLVSGFSFLGMAIEEAARVSVSYLVTVLISFAILMHVNKLKQRLVEESIRDPMTGAYNRRQLSVNLENCLVQKKRNNINSAILMIDIDHFKYVNDSFGHNVGDEVIKHLVNIINEYSREGDLLFRVGGEEFILLLHDTNSDGALHVADMLLGIVVAKQMILNHMVTVSIGVCASFDNLSQDKWIKYADTALYHAKGSGRNQVQLYNYCDESRVINSGV